MSGRSGGRPHHLTTLTVLSVGIVGFSAQLSVIGPVLPNIENDLGTSQATATWALTGYLLAASIATPLGGRMGDLWGRKRVFVIALSALAFGALVAAMASSVAVLIVGRCIQGIGGAALPTAFGIIRDEFPPAKVSRGVGAISASLALGGGIGLIFAGPLVDTWGWRALFWVLSVVLAAAAAAAYVVVPGSADRQRGRISLLPPILLAGLLTSLLTAATQANGWGWTSTKVLSLLVVALVAFPLWLWAESRATHPLIDLRLMRNPTFRVANLAALLLGIPLYSGIFVIPAFLREPKSTGFGWGASVTQCGVYMLPWPIAAFVFGVLSGPLVERWGPKRSLVAGAVIAATAHVEVTVLHDQPWHIYLFAGLVGAGLGLAVAALATTVVHGVPGPQVGMASGVNANLRGVDAALMCEPCGTSGSR